MSIGTLLIIVFVLYPLASLMMLLTLCLYKEYNLYRDKQVAEEQLEKMLGVERVTEESFTPNILDYSGTSAN